MIRHTLADEQVAQPLKNVLACQLLGNVDREALTSELVHKESASESAFHRRYDRPQSRNSIRGYDGSNVAERTSHRSTKASFVSAAF